LFFAGRFEESKRPIFLRVSESHPYNPRIHWFAAFTAVATLGLIGIGGVVTSSGVGMAVPDWPNTYGYNMFFFPFSQWVGGILWEHSHRLFASAVGLLTLILSIWFFGRPGRSFLRYFFSPFTGAVGLWAYFLDEPRLDDAAFLLSVSAFSLVVSFFWPRCQPSMPLLRWMGVIAVIGVIGQGVLGGLRVTLFADQIGIVHAAIAQLFFIFVCSIALLSSRWWARLKSVSKQRLNSRLIGWGLVVLTLMIFAQLILGASMRHQHAGLAVAEFPLIASGKVWPATDDASLAKLNRDRLDYREFNPITKNHVVLHMSHRIMAIGLFFTAAILTVYAVRRLPKGHWLGSFLIVWFSIICLQALLGAATVWSNKAADIATFHVVLGAVTLALGTLLSMIALRLAHPVPSHVSASVESFPELAAGSKRPASGMAHSLF
jgi:cytochrome c oxidase assembly protein subunit 15